MKILTIENLMLHCPSEDKFDAVRRVGSKLVENGYVDPAYVEGMLMREQSMSTYIGNGVAIPHGMPEYARYIRASGITVAQYRGGIPFGPDQTAYLVIGIAGMGDQHLDMLSRIAAVCLEPENVRRLVRTDDAREMLHLLQQEDWG
ncbi:MAG: PTS sugar transporter subunit IIA [Kyrpidia sp.]|nr:PTS sugar transporter subunit IIA [Kyrpidia sp.]